MVSAPPVTTTAPSTLAAPRGSSSTRLAFAFFLCAYVAYASLFIFRTSFVIDGTRYFSLQDDGMVSMRYAKNLADGYGLVWNPGGARVQGYTNPLWVGMMAAIHRLPIAPARTSLAVQLVALTCLVCTLFLVRALANGRWWPAVLMTATYLPLNNWSLQGSEVAILAPLVAGAVLAADASRARGTSSLLPYALLAAAVLVRLDMAVPFAVVIAMMVWQDPARRQYHALGGAGLLLAAVLAQLGFSWWYFGDALPNTYYLKMTGYPPLPRIARGAWVLLLFLAQMSPGLALAALALWGERSARSRLLAAVVLGQMAYSVYVGGDAWEWWGGSNRYVAVAMPLLFVLAGRGFVELLSLTARRAAHPGRRRIVEAATLGVLLVVFNETRGRTALREWLLVDRPMEVESNMQAVDVALRIKDATNTGTTIAVTWAGALPYFSERPAIDLLGKTDPVVAREPMHAARWREFLPGHLKWDYAHSIGTLRPDIVTQLWRDQDSALPFLEREYELRRVGPATVFVRRPIARVFRVDP